MELTFEQLDDAALVAVIDAAVSALTDDRVRLQNGQQRLQLLVDAVRLDARLSAWRSALAAEVEQSGVAVAEHGTSTVTWLADATCMTRRAAGRLVIEGQRLTRFPTVAAAAAEGCVLPEQAQAITQVLDGLPTDFDTGQLRQAEELMVSPTPTTPTTCAACRATWWRCSTPTRSRRGKRPGWNATCAPRSTTGTSPLITMVTDRSASEAACRWLMRNRSFG